MFALFAGVVASVLDVARHTPKFFRQLAPAIDPNLNQIGVSPVTGIHIRLEVAHDKTKFQIKFCYTLRYIGQAADSSENVLISEITWGPAPPQFSNIWG